MNTGPTPISAGIAGTPLANTAVDSKKKSNQQIANQKNDSAIRDTLETSDREADGQRPLLQDESHLTSEPGDQIDLCG